MSSFVSTQLPQSSVHLSLLMIFQINASISPQIRPQSALHNQEKKGSFFDQSNLSVKRELMSITEAVGQGIESQLQLNIFEIFLIFLDILKIFPLLLIRGHIPRD